MQMWPILLMSSRRFVFFIISSRQMSSFFLVMLVHLQLFGLQPFFPAIQSVFDQPPSTQLNCAPVSFILILLIIERVQLPVCLSICWQYCTMHRRTLRSHRLEQSKEYYCIMSCDELRVLLLFLQFLNEANRQCCCICGGRRRQFVIIRKSSR